MSFLHFVTVHIVSLSLALPLTALRTCCCTVTKNASTYCLVPEQTGGCCHCVADTSPSRVHTIPDHCKSQCDCSVEILSAVFSERAQKDEDSTSFTDFLFSDTQVFPSSSFTLKACPNRHQIGHNRRQALLCVWLK